MATDAKNETTEENKASEVSSETTEATESESTATEDASATAASTTTSSTTTTKKKKSGPSTKSTHPKTKVKKSERYAYMKPEPEPEPAAKSKNLPIWAWVLICCAALVVGLLVGVYAIPTQTGIISLSGRTTITEAELDSTIATYTYDGETYSITAREVIEQNESIDDAVNDDGTYDLPNTEDVLSYAQNAIVLAVADEEGIEVTDDDISELANTTFGTDDIETIAYYYGIDEDVAEEVLTNSVKMSKLRDSVVTTELPDLPDEPTEPEDDEDEDEATEEYATYIIEIIGDEWDAENDTWASEDGDYYATLSGYEISNDSATYAAAYACYEVACTLYVEAYNEQYTEWNTYVNSLLSEATITIGTLVVIS